MREKEMHLITVNRDKKVTEECIIPVEKINGPVLLLSSVNDAVLPSFESGKYMEKRLAELNFAFPHKHITYPNMSHMMITDVSGWMKLFFQI